MLLRTRTLEYDAEVVEVILKSIFYSCKYTWARTLFFETFITLLKSSKLTVDLFLMCS